MLEINNIYNGDCLEVMKLIEDNSINLILTDLPFGMDAEKDENYFEISKKRIEEHLKNK